MLFGLLTTRITDVMMWIVGTLYGGYVMANVLKWYWWRFNGYGYFWGMMAGIGGAMVVPESPTLIAERRAEIVRARLQHALYLPGPVRPLAHRLPRRHAADASRKTKRC